jgi:hypothetical protein
MGTNDGLIPEAEWRARQDDYLRFVVDKGLAPGDIHSIMAFAEWARRTPGFSWDPAAATPEAQQRTFDKLKAFKDTGDFDINRFLFLLARYRDDITPELRAALEERVLAFKYWWTEPTPDGVIDSQYYWTENHTIIFLANEYIAGQLYPDRTFTNSGMSGRDHMAHAEPLIRQWIEWRARFGFSEWLSDVYVMEDVKGLLLLAEHAEDAELARLAAMMMDVLTIELAAHLQAGMLGSTHGRSYMKNKTIGFDQDCWTMAKIIFDDTDLPYRNVDNGVLIATAQRWRPPEIARRIAKAPGPAVIRTRQSLPLDPLAPIDPNAEAPYGLTYPREGELGDAERQLLLWWSMGAQFPWQIVPLSVDTMQRYNLWKSDNFKVAAAFEPIVASSTVGQLQQLAHQLALPLNAGLLSEVNTYTWRSDEVMLSSAQSWRPGAKSQQNHVTQATIDPLAVVFTTHPYDPVPADFHTDEGYWTGNGATPRAAQHENVAIQIFAPQYESGGLGGAAFEYEPYTHAFFPTELFDDVVERNGWVIGRKGDGYIALWSYRPTSWRSYEPGSKATRDLTERFDLVAEGGADNVWIYEVGRAADWRGRGATGDPFAAFVDAVSAAPIAVTRLGAGGPADGFDVRYQSPTQGEVRFGWTRPLTVAGQERALGGYPRHDGPWGTVELDSTRYELTYEGWGVALDFATARRETSGPGS